VVLEKTLEGPLDCKEIQPVHSEGDQPWDFFGRNDGKAEIPVLWPPHVKFACCFLLFISSLTSLLSLVYSNFITIENIHQMTSCFKLDEVCFID